MRARRLSQPLIRRFSSQKEVFDRSLKTRQRDWSFGIEESEYYDYLRAEAADRLVGRLEDISREFPMAIDLGGHRGHISKSILEKSTEVETYGVLGGIKKLVQCDVSAAACAAMRENASKHSMFETEVLQIDEEGKGLSSLESESFDLVMSSMSLHWVNDLPSTLREAKRILKPDGCFIGCMLGGSTLQELRYSFYLAEQERSGGVSPHMSPFALPRDVASLMQGAGFNLPTIDIENISIGYPNAIALMEHLGRMGEGNASINRNLTVGTDAFLATAATYQSLYGLADGTVPASFQLIYMIGWAPHASQPVPLKRGSASRSMKELEKGPMKE